MIDWTGQPVFGREVSLKSTLVILHERRSGPPLIVELGCCPDYNIHGLGNAILAFAFYAGRYGADIISVDVEGDPIYRATLILDKYLPAYKSIPQFVHEDAFTWAPRLNRPIGLLYMDAAMELDYSALYDKFSPECFPSGALMLFDDTDPRTFAGKGRDVIPRILREGWQEVEAFGRVPVHPMVLLEKV